LAFGTTNFTRDLGADIVMESITLIDRGVTTRFFWFSGVNRR